MARTEVLKPYQQSPQPEKNKSFEDPVVAKKRPHFLPELWKPDPKDPAYVRQMIKYGPAPWVASLGELLKFVHDYVNRDLRTVLTEKKFIETNRKRPKPSGGSRNQEEEDEFFMYLMMIQNTAQGMLGIQPYLEDTQKAGVKPAEFQILPETPDSPAAIIQAESITIVPPGLQSLPEAAVPTMPTISNLPSGGPTAQESPQPA